MINLDNIPENPGIYIMKKGEKVIYVGKAKNLKNRVFSYFKRKIIDSRKTEELVKNVENLEYIITKSEVDALILENNLIKKYKPKYNILLKDEKTYPYIYISKEKFPKLSIIRSTKKSESMNGEYFGPYPSSQSAYEIVRLINQIFSVRKCRHIPDSPCLYYHMHQCLGPCIHEVDPKENEKTRKKIKKFLSGDTKEVMDFRRVI